MQTVFDGPVPPSQFEKPSRTGLVLAERCAAVDGFPTVFAGGNFFGASLYAKDLFDTGEVKVVIEGGTTPDPPGLQAAMRLFSDAVLWGGKALRCRSAMS